MAKLFFRTVRRVRVVAKPEEQQLVFDWLFNHDYKLMNSGIRRGQLVAFGEKNANKKLRV
jgi:hypothetical protein